MHFSAVEPVASTGMGYAKQDCIRSNVSFCALFDKSVFVFFSVFYLISLENRAELICSPAVSLSLNYAKAKEVFLSLLLSSSVLYLVFILHLWL